jgi:hypothetical protein
VPPCRSRRKTRIGPGPNFGPKRPATGRNISRPDGITYASNLLKKSTFRHGRRRDGTGVIEFRDRPVRPLRHLSAGIREGQTSADRARRLYREPARLVREVARLARFSLARKELLGSPPALNIEPANSVGTRASGPARSASLSRVRKLVGSRIKPLAAAGPLLQRSCRSPRKMMELQPAPVRFVCPATRLCVAFR